LRELAAGELGVILDIVPNHMGVGEENRWWSDPDTRSRWFDLDPAGGYRRFFDIDDMAAVRQELEEVFQTTHAKVLQLVREGVLDGLRVDHPDGLADPAGYLRRLRAAGVQRIWVEKILHPAEQLRPWPVSGTVGYEFLGDVGALFVDPAGERPLTELLAEVTGESRAFAQVALEAQLEQARGSFAREVARLARLHHFDAATIEQALACLPVYRTYVEPWSGLLEGADREAIDACAAAAESGSAPLVAELARALLLEEAIPAEFVTRFQQTSPAIAAKGIEDTAFYRYPRLLSLNEVGGDPERFGLSVEDFHARNRERCERFPQTLLSTQTHDTKRSGDVRARIGALSTMPERWRERVLAWRAIGERLRDGERAPDGLEEHLLHQTLIAVWPIGRERLDAYLVKALREGKRNTSWTEPNEHWERATLAFAHRLIDSEQFMADFAPFCEEVALMGERSALGQLLLKLTCPGVPDIYQGDELWRLSLVDPDNRRPVDWRRRREALARLRAGSPPTRETIKLHLHIKALDLRRRHPELFADGPYTPIPGGEHVCAFMRGDSVLVIVQLRPAGASATLESTPELAAAIAHKGRTSWRELLSGRELRLDRERAVGAIAGEHGLALLERSG
jgi:(1->4)-alpha-D-glucan 1-alpha-D-glucosylmutase